MSEEKTKITFLDLFAGIGGFRLALERLGWRCVGFSEVDKWCVRTYKENFDTSDEVELGDIRRVDIMDIPDFDVLCAGFPCQPFSIMGHRRGFEDTRGTLFFEILRILRDRRPKAFILENVRGLTNHDNGRTFQTILQSLSHTINNQQPLSRYRDSINYHVFWKIMNSKYFGVPQSRERVYIVGFRENVSGFRFPKGESPKKVMRDILEEEVDPPFFLNLRQVERMFRLGRVAKDISPTLVSAYGRFGKSSFSIITKVKSRSHSDRAYSLDGLSPTLITKSPVVVLGEVDGRNPPQMRWLTPRECARLQGFPDSFRIVAPKDKAYEEFGNAVTVPLVEAIGREVERWIG